MTDTGHAVEQEVPREEMPDDLSLVDEAPARRKRGLPLRVARPDAARAVGVLLLIFAVFGACLFVLCLLLFGNQQVAAWKLKDLALFLVFLTLAATAVNAAMGVGLLRMAPWARSGAILAQVLLLLFGSVVGGLVLFNVPLLKQMLPGMPSDITPQIARFTALLAYAFLVFTNLLITANILFFLTRAEVVEAFRRR